MGMRLAVLIVLLGHWCICSAGQITSIDDAWMYLAKPGKVDRWVVIGSQKNKGYIQCERMRDFILCPFPVWAKVLPGPKQVVPRKPRPTPYPEVSGSRNEEYIPSNKVLLLKQTLKRHRIDAEDVYTQLLDEKGRVVGTAYDIRIVLELDFDKFVPVVQDILQRVWDTPKQDGYKFDSDS